MFTPTAERIQEAEHSLVHRAGATRRVGGAYVSLSLRLPELESLLHQEHVWPYCLAACKRVASPDELAAALGFFRHPAWKTACE